jgi:hypothetical protein
MPITKLEAVKRFFSVPEKPVTNEEIRLLMKACGPVDFAAFAAECAAALGETLTPPAK